MRVDLILAFVAFGALTALFTSTGPEPDPCETYREMRQIWEDTNSEFGWPEGAIKECAK